MNQKRVYNVINVSLVLIVILLSLNLFDVTIPSVGQVLYNLDREEPLLIVNWQGDYNKCLDLNRCCFEVVQQQCEQEKQQLLGAETDWVCGPQLENTLQYYLNNKALRYCRQMPYS